MFCIFILSNGKWKQHGATVNSVDNSWIKQEMEYLVNGLGVVAKVFKKN